MCEYYLHFDINLPYPEEELKNCIANRNKYALGKDKISQFTGKKQKKKKKKNTLGQGVQGTYKKKEVINCKTRRNQNGKAFKNFVVMSLKQKISKKKNWS